MKIGLEGVPVINVKLINEGRIGGTEAIKNPCEAVKLLAKEMADNVREVMYSINIDAKGHVLSIYKAGIGTTSSMCVTGKDIYQAAILANAASVILVHNHPGQDSTPSHSDKVFTSTIKSLGDLLGIELADHIIVAGGNTNKIYSFREDSFFNVNEEYRKSRKKAFKELNTGNCIEIIRMSS